MGPAKMAKKGLLCGIKSEFQIKNKYRHLKQQRDQQSDESNSMNGQ